MNQCVLTVFCTYFCLLSPLKFSLNQFTLFFYCLFFCFIYGTLECDHSLQEPKARGRKRYSILFFKEEEEEEAMGAVRPLGSEGHRIADKGLLNGAK